MALTATAKVIFRPVQLVLQDSEELWPARFAPVVRHLNGLTDGTGSGQGNILYAQQRTVASNSNDDLDLSGSLSDVFGDTVTAVTLVTIGIINEQADGTANTTDLSLGATPGTSPTYFTAGTTKSLGPISPGGMLLWHSPGANGICTITGSTADVLRISNTTGASNTYQVLLIFRTS